MNGSTSINSSHKGAPAATKVGAHCLWQRPAAGASLELLEAAASSSGKASQHKSVARSDSVLLVKNLPYTASEAELEALFGAVGEQIVQ